MKKDIIITRITLAALLAVLATHSANARGHKNGMDLNGDGKVTLQELQAMRDNLHDQYDADGDGFLNRQEMITAMSSMPGRTRGNERSQDFGLMDHDGDGGVSKAEFRQSAAELMMALDQNGDNVLTRKDFAKLRRGN